MLALTASTEKVPKLNMIFHDSTRKMLFLQHQNKVDYNNLDAFGVISSDFPGLKTSAASLASAASEASLANSLISSKNFLFQMLGSSLAPK